MANKITKEEVIHIAHLARLKLSEDEIDLFSGQLENIIQYVGQLREHELNLKDISPTAQSIGLKNVFREDEIKEFENRESILKNAQNRFEDFFKVKKIIE